MQLQREQKRRILRRVCGRKLRTYPERPSTGHCVAKFRSTGLFSAFGATEDEIKTVALHYDLILTSGFRSDYASLMRKYNPSLKLVIYFDSGLSADVPLTDTANVDGQNTAWILANHSERLLQGASGEPIRAGSGPARQGQYFPDPGNEERQESFAHKLNKAPERTSGNTGTSAMSQRLPPTGQQIGAVQRVERTGDAAG